VENSAGDAPPFLGLRLADGQDLRPPALSIAAAGAPGAAPAAPDEDDALADSPVVPASGEGGAPGGSAAASTNGAAKSAKPAGQSLPPETVAEKKSGRSWSRVPVIWRGTLSSYYSWARGDAGSAQTAFNKSAEFSGDTFVYAPWLLRLNGHLHLSQTDVTAERELKLGSHGGGMGMNLFPLSRFPFSAAFSVNNSDNGQGTTFSNSRYTLSQAYRPPRGEYNLSGLFERAAFRSSAESGASVVDRLTGNHTVNNLGSYPQTLVSTLNANWGRPSNGINRTNAVEVRTTHTANLYDDYGLTLNNEAAYNQSTSDGDPAISGSGFQSRFFYAQTSSQWEPYEDLPLRIGSSLRHTATELVAGGSGVSIDTTSAEANTAYSFGNYLTVGLSLRADHTRTPEGSNTTYSILGSAQSGYGVGQLKEADLWGYKYTLSYSANAGIGATTEGSTTPFVGGSLTQALSRPFEIGYGPNSPLLFNLSQNYSLTWNLEGDIPKHLSTNLDLSWQHALARVGMSSRFRASDGRTFGVRNPSWFQSLAWDNSGRLVMSPVSTLTAGLALSWARQGLSDGSGTPPEWRGNGVGSLTYQNVRLFGVPRLTYNARYSINFIPGALASSAIETAGGNIQIFSQDAAYAIGRLTLGLSHSSFYSAGSVGHSVYFTVSRALSGVL